MTKMTAVRAGIALLIFVMGSVQAWDSRVGEPQGVAGLFIVLLVSIAIAVPAVALLLPLKPAQFGGAFVLSFVLLVLARLASPAPLPGLFLVILPAGAAFIFTGLHSGQKVQEQEAATADGQ